MVAIYMARNMVLALLRREHWWAEFWSGVVAVIWGTWNLVYPSTPISLPSYVNIYSVQPAAFWEVVAVVFGMVQLITLVYDHRWPRALSALLSSWFYSCISIGFLLATPVPIGWAFCAGWVGVNAFAIVRQVGNFR